MFGLFQRKKEKLLISAPIKGKVIDITDVPDAVFAGKMMGDGVGIEPEGNVITAPCDGKVILVAKTLHAVAMEVQGVEILIHIGMDTVELEGQGFTAHIGAGDVVKKGDPLISFDREYISKQGKLLITPVVITNMEPKVKRLEKQFNSLDGVIMRIELKN
jgi:PTS system glucose-specific IIA component